MKKRISLFLLAASFTVSQFALAEVEVYEGVSESACIELSVPMMKGSRDSTTRGQVSSLQQFLQDNGYVSFEPTGNFGRLTEDAVRAFQARYGITSSDGKIRVGPLTRAKIKEISCNTSSQANNGTQANTLGTYQVYINNVLYPATVSVSRATALADCTGQKANNPTASIRCTWNGEVIMNYTPTQASTTGVPTMTLSLSNPTPLFTDGTFTISWSGTNSPTTYGLRINSKELNGLILTKWTGTPASLGMGAGNHTFSVRGCNATGCGAWSSISSFTVSERTASSVQVPTASLTINASSLTTNAPLIASWSGTNSPTSYKLKVDGVEKNAGTLTSWSGTATTLGLGVGQHTFAVQGCNASGCGAWSDVKTLTITSPTSTTSNLVPNTTVSAAPYSVTLKLDKASVDKDANFTASWSATGATEFTFKMVDDRGTLKLLPMTSGVTSWTGTPTSLGFTAGEYTMSVQACNSKGCTWSSPQTLRVTSPNEASAAPYPVTLRLDKASVDKDANFTAEWSAGVAALGTLPTEFTFRVRNYKDVTLAASVTKWTGTPASLGLAAGEYTMSVQACNSKGCTWSPEQTLRVTSPNEASAAPYPVTFQLDKASVDKDANFTASWSAGVAALGTLPTGFTFKVVDDRGTLKLLPMNSSVTSWTGTPTSLGMTAGQYTMSIQACNSKGCTWSSQQTLVVTSPNEASLPPSATLTLSPSTVDSNASFTASWSGTNSPAEYILYIDGNVRIPSTTVTSWSGTPASLGLGVGQHTVGVNACNSKGCSGQIQRTLTVTAAPKAPTAYMTVYPSSVASNVEINASWSATDSPTYYNLKVDNGNALNVGTRTSWSVTPTALGLGAGQYSFYSQGCNSVGCGAWSAPATLTVTAPVSFDPSSASLVLGASTTCVNLPGNMHRGYESSSVSKLQKFLVSLGLLDEVTGFYGDRTVSAVRDYQTRKGLPVTGMMYDLTRETIAVETCF